LLEQIKGGSKMITVSVLNRKGGVGKTTIASNIVQALGLLERKVLVIDNDEQGNMGFSLGITQVPEINLANVYKDPSVVLKAIYSTRLETVDIIAGSPRLSLMRPSRNALKDILSNETIKNHYDYCVIDNGPSLDELTLSAVEASSHYIIPVIPDTFAVQGLISLVKIFEEKEIDTNKIHILINRYQENMLNKMCCDFVVNTYQSKVLKTKIPNDNALTEMVAKGKCILLSKSTSKSVVPFLELLVELFNFNVDGMMIKLKDVREKAKREVFEKHLAPRMFRAGQNKTLETQVA
jgi:chromosome partitioning protein